MPKLSGEEKVLVIVYWMHFPVCVCVCVCVCFPQFLKCLKKNSFVDYLSLGYGIVGQW